MKYTLLIITALLLFSSCGNNKLINCGDFTAFEAQQNAGILEISFTDNANIGTYEFSIAQISAGNEPQNGVTFIEASTGTLNQELSEVSISMGESYYLWIRGGTCEGDLGDKESWHGPIVVQLDEYCEAPYDLGHAIFPTGRGVAWNTYYNETDADYFEVQYGLEGFAVGSGTTVTTNKENTTEFSLEKDNAYDFYVRSHCTNNLGWSAWVGPVSYYATFNQNLCTTPSNVVYHVNKNGFGDPVGAWFEWERNGEYYFEYTIVLKNNPPSGGQLYTSTLSGWPSFSLTQNTDYDFYVRAICLDDTRTVWFGPTTLNIGD